MPLILFLYVLGVFVVYYLARYLGLNRRFWLVLAIIASPLVAVIVLALVWIVKLLSSNHSTDDDKSQ